MMVHMLYTGQLQPLNYSCSLKLSFFNKLNTVTALDEPTEGRTLDLRDGWVEELDTAL